MSIGVMKRKIFALTLVAVILIIALLAGFLWVDLVGTKKQIASLTLIKFQLQIKPTS